jgi:hypothetical protein
MHAMSEAITAEICRYSFTIGILGKIDKFAAGLLQ